VRVFDGRDGSLLGTFQPFTAAITDGVFVAAGDVNGDGHADIIVGTDQASSAQVKVLSGADGSVLAQWTLDLGSGRGVRVAAGDVNGDGRADVIAAVGPGGQPWVEVRDAVTQAPLYHFLAFDPTFRGGVLPTAGDFNGDGKADLLCGAGSGNDVSLFSGADDSSLARFAPFASSFHGGVRVAAVDGTGDGQPEIVTAMGPNGGEVRAFDAPTLHQLASLFPTGSRSATACSSAATPGRACRRWTRCRW